jgi:hypothetical protein
MGTDLFFPAAASKTKMGTDLFFLVPRGNFEVAAGKNRSVPNFVQGKIDLSPF